MISWDSVRSAPDASWLVRYSFESPAHLARHLTLGEGLFLPERALPCGPGARVLVEIGFPHASDSPLLHGRVRARERAGLWVDLPSARAMARWVPAVEAPRRRHRRLASDLFAEVRPAETTPYLCRVLDLSAGGVRLATGSLEAGLRGDEVDLTLLAPGEPALELRARLVWSGAREAGLELFDAGPLAGLIAVAEARWSSVQQIPHDAACSCASRR